MDLASASFDDNKIAWYENLVEYVTLGGHTRGSISVNEVKYHDRVYVTENSSLNIPSLTIAMRNKETVFRTNVTYRNSRATLMCQTDMDCIQVIGSGTSPIFIENLILDGTLARSSFLRAWSLSGASRIDVSWCSTPISWGHVSKSIQH